MKIIILSLIILQGSASAAILQDQSLEDEGDIFIFEAYPGNYWSALTFSTINGAYDYWLACDYTPPTGETVEFRGFGCHICYDLDDSSALDDIAFEVYENNLNSSPISEFICNVSRIAQNSTGWQATTFSPPRDIYWIEMTFEEPDWVGGLNGDTQYWIAYQMDSYDEVFTIATYLEFGDEAWQVYVNGYWESTSTYYYESEDFDIATRIQGGTAGGIETVSLGKIKAAFN